jgi:dephospho-CoA kinase
LTRGADNKPVIGLTGGIASGKSRVAHLLGELGAAVIDADQVAREVVAPGTDGLRAIISHFGEGVLAAEGSLDREKLGKIAFSDVQARAALNAIMHPRIGQRSAQASTAPYVVYEAALLVETGIYKGLSALVVVATPQYVQLERAVARDGMLAEAVQARIDSQLPLADKVAVADYVIENDGDLDTLQARTLDVHQRIMKRFASPDAAQAR